LIVPAARPDSPVDQPDDTTVSLGLALGGDEPQHIGGRYFSRRLVDDPEERLQV